MSVPEKLPAYRIEWRAAQTGTRAHVTITEIHPLVERAALTDPNGRPITRRDIETAFTHGTSLKLARLARPSDRRCDHCLTMVGYLDMYVEKAAWDWAIEQLTGVLHELAASAPIAPPADES